MNSKNWGDKADKDLFFTILSVKNIGVISGSEWTTIGNHMRSLGYGFTNEGCRQHFQGLRRAQQKAEANGALGDNPRKIDPTLNPITRRPGPGRGRPRKSVGAATADGQGADSASPSPSQTQIQHQQQQQQQPPQAQALDLEQSMQPQPPMDPGVGPAPTPMMDAAPTQAQAPMPPPQQPAQPPQPMVLQPEGVVSFEGAGEEPDEHAAKRPKLEENHDPALNDEAILSALAAHTSPGVDHYNPDFYGEA
ncbi:hypothetical protein KVR01_009791 [Diaporthe batatas]|uniref:uncharacterized protein n=1 Tax=Diaporthe batatas TaxID=748121 RepID=UPI001D0515D8|nr:uncharacterized protein KVR01_009791 [Diaporthe batatas]KAG8160255.1 hypothetical protein KVR01_009791 [Diaporthe batatas]